MPIMSGARRPGDEPLLRRQARKHNLRSKLNLASFAATFALLAAMNLPALRSVAVASVSVEATAALPAEMFAVRSVSLIGNEPPGLPATPKTTKQGLAKAPPVKALVPHITQPRPDAKPKRAVSLPFGLFGSLEFRTNASKGISGWHKALARLDNEQPLYLLCDAGALSCPPRYRKWRRLLNAVRGLPKADQLKRLNAGINALIKHRDDTDVFAARDYWASPMEFLLNGGDCEDYTILKYASLLKLGYSDQQLRIAVVRDVSRRIDHAVLAVADAQGAIILDNMSDTPVSHEQIVHYRPVYSVNRHSRWVHIATRQISRLHAAQTAKAGRAGPIWSMN